jgi:hypothetical protein
MIYESGEPQQTKELGEKPVPVPLYPSQILHWSDPGANPSLCIERLVANHLSYRTAILILLLSVIT